MTSPIQNAIKIPRLCRGYLICGQSPRMQVPSIVFRKFRNKDGRSVFSLPVNRRRLSRCFMFMYFFEPHWVPATCRSQAHTSINAELPSGKVPTTGTPANLTVEPLNHVVGPDSHPMLIREVHVCRHFFNTPITSLIPVRSRSFSHRKNAPFIPLTPLPHAGISDIFCRLLA